MYISAGCARETRLGGWMGGHDRFMMDGVMRKAFIGTMCIQVPTYLGNTTYGGGEDALFII